MNSTTNPQSVPPASGKHISLTSDLASYIDRHRTGADDPIFDQIRESTAQFGEDAIMQIPDHQGTLVTIVARLIGATSALEIGTFTGASSICIARGLPETGKLICMDSSATWTDVAQSFWKQAGVDSKIELQLGDALELIPGLPSSTQFDLVHIDAEKLLYDQFFEATLPLVRSGGLYVFDNMLRGGRVVQTETDDRTAAIKQLNQKLATDSRVESVLIEVGDGLQICRKR